MLAPAVLQPISTIGSGIGRPRTSLIPVSRVPRISAVGGGNGFQPFVVPGAIADGKGVVCEKNREPETDRSGSLGVGLTEKEIDERVGFLPSGTKL